jgi:DNA-binding NtrC family response regulator
MSKKKKILLVDDEADFRETMGKFFTRREVDFSLAESCMDALEQIEYDDYDVVVMDVTMPGLDGLKCMAEMKKVHPHIEVIILTGHASPHAGVAGIRKGAFDYCLKPIDFEELLEKIMLARKSLDG